MDSTHIYQKIIESIRLDIHSGILKPGARLPAIRKMTEAWKCNAGTVLRAYQELARLGLVESHAGKGTRVVDHPVDQNQTPMRRAELFNRTENFLLEMMKQRYTPDEIEQSLHVALDRWRTVTREPEENPPGILRFVGSHDQAMALVAAHFQESTEGFALQLSFTGSLGGLIALAEKKADLAGSHLWDENTDTYNEPFVRKLLPGKKVAMLTLAHRRVGLIVPTGNPQGMKSISDLAKPGIRFVNRQPGSGTRVWLDTQLNKAGIDPARISGYQNEKMTHSEVAKMVSQGEVDAGIGIETATIFFGLDFQFLTTERYDLIIPLENWENEPVQALVGWLDTAEAKTAINSLGGYDTTETGRVVWVS